MAKNANSQTIYLKDYQPPAFELSSCEMDFALDAKQTTVNTRYQIRAIGDGHTLRLDGESLKLLSVKLDQQELDNNQYELDDRSLTITEVPAQFTLEIQTEISPAANTSLSGLYQSGDMLCTQCEAQGFRSITYSLDRPDVLTTYTVKLSADKSLYPVLLSNGNLIEQGESGTTHYAVWHDPFPKPTYLFALVAGNLSYHSDTFTTRSGKVVDLHVLTRPDDVGKTSHALESLQKAMRWDEQVYDREYDLDIFHIVAVSDFNMGAMENKSLNIFNTKYVLARQEIATDQDYQAIEGVIGHEYFHNWSGNRVTCRDWFQLSLKEGFTVFRDQQFSADMGSHGVQRINDVNLLRTAQFKEDAGPMAHPVRPQSYEEINNFYTATVYDKGAEVVRMIRTLLGAHTFKQATNRYFDNFDGGAVTTDDFVDTMEQTSGIDLSQFRRWYDQAGTPEVSLSSHYDARRNSLRLDFSQHTPDTPGQQDKQPLLIPIRTALFKPNGERMRFSHEGENQLEAVLHLTDAQQSIELGELESEPVVSVLRSFSAPIKLRYEQDASALGFLACHDDDPFNRWEAMQQLSLRQIELCMADKAAVLAPEYVDLYGQLLQDKQTDPALLAQLLILPSESIISQRMDVIDPELVYHSRERILQQLVVAHKDALHDRYVYAHNQSSGSWTQAESAYRSLRDTCLAVLMRLEHEAAYALAMRQYERASCMTDTISALASLAHSRYANKQHYLDDFHQQWHHEALLIDKWFSLQSREPGEHTLNNIKSLTKHIDFDKNNPNKVYALIGGLLFGNAVTFHTKDGSGYRFARKWILKLDQYNPQVAARMVSCFNQWKRYDEKRQEMMQKQMQRIAHQEDLSDNVSEIIHKALG